MSTMTTPGAAGMQAMYDQWLSVLPQFFAQFGVPPAAQAGGGDGAARALPFPADQVAKAAALTQNALTSIAQSYAPLLQSAGAPALLAQWTRLAGGTTDAYVTAFERTFGAVSDALGLGPMRKLQAAYAELMNAGAAQNEARAAYALLVQSAFTSGWDELLRRLADKAQRGEHIDSMLALMRLWASATEDAVHRVLQSQPGLDATAAVMRAALAYRRKLQAVAGIVADMLDMATRRELDEAYREIQQLKRELRSMRSTRAPHAQRPGADNERGGTTKARSRARRKRSS
jgi:hypothetical protein